jgi:hypothetical protein
MILELIALALAILVLVATAYVFKKAGRKPWLAIIPFYNQWVTYEIAGSPPKWCLTYNIPIVMIYAIGLASRRSGKATNLETLGLGIMTVAAIVGVVLYAITCMRLAERFNKSRRFGFLMLLLISPVGWSILAFGDAKYHKVNPKGNFKPRKFQKEMV